jgi:hypothetical protein
MSNTVHANMFMLKPQPRVHYSRNGTAPEPQKRSATHTQNSVVRPQNRHLKPFKSRAELNGKLDPRINVGGRPKILYEETAKWLCETDKTGKTNARKLIESMGEAAMRSMSPHSVAAFKAIKDTVEAEERDESRINPNILHASIIDIINRSVGERQKNPIAI